MKTKNLLKDLEVEVVEPKDHHQHPEVYHPYLPQHEFSMLIVAPKGSGKTNLLCNFILKFYKKYFHRILVCSPTVMNDEKWTVVKKTRHVLARNRRLEEILENKKPKSKIKKVVFNGDKPLDKQLEEIEDPWDGKIPEDDFFSDLDTVIEKVREQQDTIKKLHDKGYEQEAKFIADRMLVILDDQAGMFKISNSNNPMSNFVIKHRHASSSVIIVTQGYKAIPKMIRTNCNALVLFDIPNESELYSIYEENPEGHRQQDWMKLYHHATAENFSFMYINNKFPKGERIFKRFDRMLQIRSKRDRDAEAEKDIDSGKEEQKRKHE